MNRYETTKSLYASLGIDVEQAIDQLRQLPISLHVWQGDDVQGLEHHQTSLSGGIQATGNYPGKARDFKELKADIQKAISHIPGKKRLNLHAMYAVSKHPIERNALEPHHFDPWIDFALEHDLKIDFNPTFFSHPKVKDNLTLSSPDAATRDYWIQHGVQCRDIAAYIGKKQNSPCLFNVWIPDGYKDHVVDKYGPRRRLKESLDQIFAKKYSNDLIIDAVESKVFGIGLESFTVGSSEFYMNYAQEKGLCCLIDNGHYHPLENVADKLSSMALFSPYVALHVTRPVRWDSDHVVLLDDTVKEIAKEIILSNDPSKFLIGLDYFDASINRIAAWVIGTRNFQKALLIALLTPFDTLKKHQDEANFTELMMLQEYLKTLPFIDIWEHYLKLEGQANDKQFFEDIKQYEINELKKRDPS